MEKLLQLLNEYMALGPFEFINYDEEYNIFRIIPWIYHKELSPETITGKRFWFIKWLVENDRVDEREAKSIFYDKDFYVHWNDITFEYLIIMYSSIQDDFIEFLISILK